MEIIENNTHNVRAIKLKQKRNCWHLGQFSVIVSRLNECNLLVNVCITHM